jgi:hypothetical protein
MAKYRQLMIDGKDGFYLCNPANIFEAIHLAYLLWRYPEKVCALIHPAKEYVIEHFKVDNVPKP